MELAILADKDSTHSIYSPWIMKPPSLGFRTRATRYAMLVSVFSAFSFDIGCAGAQQCPQESQICAHAALIKFYSRVIFIYVVVQC